ncbi:MAG TPA: Ni/Fe hydrogenase subunit alpha [Actinomycetota bacterium]|nr:Ni/Fe hydrogenase subunit alpha [Actinomycetota bacterium]
MTHRSVEVPVVARVEGEGALHVRVDDGVITRLELEIYEPPRFFEAFLAGRNVMEVPDIVARICGICPVAYQSTAMFGLERLFEVELPSGVEALRRLLYMAEWIESHMLHVHLLALPDFLGVDSAIELAQRGFKAEVERGLRLKRLGNELMAAIGGREIHPVNPRIGGFWRSPRRREVDAFVPRLEDAAREILDVADLVASLEVPVLTRDAELVAMVEEGRYPIDHGDVASTRGRRWRADEHEAVTRELHVEHSNALHSVMADTGEPYVVGPLARVVLNEAALTPVAREAKARLGLTLPTVDPFASMAARVVETALAIEEALRLIRAYEPPDPPHAGVVPRAGRATWTTEAPRGTIYHRYDVAADGTIVEAKIVPPTSQNLRHMEHDLREFLPSVLDRPDDELTRLAEMIVRNYDPCISCATHFLRVEIERGDEG